VVVDPRSGRLGPVCTDKGRHARKGASAIKTPPKAGADAQARAEKAARKEATEHRRAFVTALLAGRVTKADVLALVLPNYLDDANANEQAAIAKLLGVEPGGDGRYDRWGDALRAYTGASEANLLRTCLAFSLVQGEDAVAGAWGYERAERHRAFLVAKGYGPTPYELQQDQEAAKRHEQFQADVERGRQLTAQGADNVGQDDDDASVDEEAVPEDAG
jgi:hypothetical protein